MKKLIIATALLVATITHAGDVYDVLCRVENKSQTDVAWHLGGPPTVLRPGWVLIGVTQIDENVLFSVNGQTNAVAWDPERSENEILVLSIDTNLQATAVWEFVPLPE